MSFDVPRSGGDDTDGTDVSFSEGDDGTATFKLGDKSLGDQGNRINAFPSTPALSDVHEQSGYLLTRVRRTIQYLREEVNDQIDGVIESVSGSKEVFERGVLHDMSDPSLNTPDSFREMVGRAVVFLLLRNNPDEPPGQEEVANTLALVVRSALNTKGQSLANILDEYSLRTENSRGK